MVTTAHGLEPARRNERVSIALHFGALAKPLHEQLPIARRRLKFLQRCADAVTLLAVHDFLAPSESARARRRILQRVAQTFRRELVDEENRNASAGRDGERDGRRGAVRV